MIASAATLASLLSYPLYATIALAACGLAVRLLFGWRRFGAACIAVAIAWSLLWSIPVCSDWLRGTLESRYTQTREESLPKADAIVVLGGATRYRWVERGHSDPWTLRSSRVAAGARAWLAGRAPVVILSGGRDGPEGTEASRMKTALARLGVPPHAMLLEERSHDTRDNAIHTAELARRQGIGRVLLVTSALHMPRAVALFERTGLEVIPVPVPEHASRGNWRERWVPSPSALWRSGRALKEYLALFADSRGLHARR